MEYDFEIKQRMSRAKLVRDILSRMEGKELQLEEIDGGDLVSLVEFASDKYEEKLTKVYQFLRTGRIEPIDYNEKITVRRWALKFVALPQTSKLFRRK